MPLSSSSHTGCWSVSCSYIDSNPTCLYICIASPSPYSSGSHFIVAGLQTIDHIGHVQPSSLAAAALPCRVASWVSCFHNNWDRSVCFITSLACMHGSFRYMLENNLIVQTHSHNYTYTSTAASILKFNVEHVQISSLGSSAAVVKSATVVKSPAADWLWVP